MNALEKFALPADLKKRNASKNEQQEKSEQKKCFFFLWNSLHIIYIHFTLIWVRVLIWMKIMATLPIVCILKATLDIFPELHSHAINHFLFFVIESLIVLNRQSSVIS